MREMTPLCLLARKYETDKGGRHLRYNGGPCSGTHEYTPVYWDLMEHRRETVQSVLEIGVNSGASLRMWAEFFPNAKVTGFDIEHGHLFHDGRIRCFHADQSNPHSLRNALQQAQTYPFDLIVDDGSHIPEHQIVSLNSLLPFLMQNGVYVIEDVRTDPGSIGVHTPPGYWWTEIETDPGVGEWNRPEKLIVVRRM